eukprot:676540-Prymnesium_polylepis.1
MAQSRSRVDGRGDCSHGIHIARAKLLRHGALCRGLRRLDGRGALCGQWAWRCRRPWPGCTGPPGVGLLDER